MKRYLTYQHLSFSDEANTAQFDEQQAKQQHRFEIQEDAYDIYRASVLD